MPDLMKKLLVLFVWANAAVCQAVEIRFVAFDFGVPAGDYAVRQPGKDGSKSFRLRINSFSERIKVAEGVHELVMPDGSSATRFKISEAESSRLLMVVLPDAAGKVSLFRVTDDTTGYGPGERVFLNVTGGGIRVMLGDQRISIPSAKSALAKAPGTKAGDPRVPVRMFSQSGGEWKLFNSTMWPQDPESRSIILIYPDAKSRFPRVRSLSEVVVIKKEANP